MLKLGIWGGTFDPVHLGHLQMASEARAKLSLDRMMMLPAGDPPHRSGSTSAQHRLNMLKAALTEYPDLAVDDREVQRSGSSWSVLSCREYRSDFPDALIYWCMGVDAFDAFDSWHAWQEILTLVNIAVIDRPGSELTGQSDIWQRLDTKPTQTEANSRAGSVVCLSLHEVAVSSTQLRADLHAGQTSSFGMSEPVWQYIHNHKLYSQ